MDKNLEKRVLCTIFDFPLVDKKTIGRYCFSWDDLLQRLQAVKRYDRMTVSQFLAAKKPLEIKSCGGYYIMGKCFTDSYGLPSRAKTVQAPVEFGILAIDGDGVAADWDETVKHVLGSYEYFIHASISSHRGDIRRRLVVPLAQNVDAETREALARIVCSQMGMQGMDKTCIEAKRGMALPVVLSDGDTYAFHNNTGKFLDAVEWLNASGIDWHDYEHLPKFPSEDEIKKKIKGITRGKIEETGEWTPPKDISDKWVSAFCRTYKITDIFERCRPGYYTQWRPGRWNHAEESNCNGGIQVVNDAYCYSWYATDKLSTGKLMNAFEVYAVLSDLGERKAKTEIKADPQVQEAYRQEVLKSLQIPPCAESWADQYDVTDEGLARRCFEAFPSKRRDGAWMDYADGVYKPVSNEQMLLKVGNVARIVAATQPFDENAGKYVGSTNKLKAVLTQWQGLADAAAPAEEDWDNQPTYLAFKDCIIDLKKFMACSDWATRESVQSAVVEFSPDLLLTKKLAISLDDLFKDTKLTELNRNMALYLPDPETRNYFWTCIGSCLDGSSYADNKVIWLNGPHAGNGKSTVMAAITSALGSYAGVSEVALFYKSRNDDNGEGASPKLNALRNTRLAHFAEGDKRRTINTSKIKNFTGGQKIYTRSLYRDGSEWLPRFRMVYDSNGMPALDEADEGFYRRLRIIPFKQSLRHLEGGEDDTLNRWQTDTGIHAAVILMMLIGLRQWYENGKKTDKGVETCPMEVRRETLAYSSSFESTADYFEDHIVVTGNDKDFVSKTDFWTDYNFYLTGKGVGKHTFYMDLEEWLSDNGCRQTKRRINNVPYTGWAGCKLAAAEDENSWLYREGRLQKQGFQPYYERHKNFA